MAPPLELSIPSTKLSNDSKPYTLYNISLRLPLRTFVVQKRYSDFVTLHSTLTSLISTAPPEPLPSKSWFRSTASSPELTETRRIGLEKYMRAIAEGPDRRWRETSAWRTFLNLPSSGSGGSASSVRGELAAQRARGTGSEAGLLTSDPQVWLDVLREMKGQLHDARLFLSKRDSATTAQAQYEAGAGAKRCLVKATGLIGNLDEGLKILAEEEKRGNGRGMGTGELRRRRDLLAAARGERDGLEKLSVSLAVKSQDSKSATSSAAASQTDKSALFGGVSQPSRRVLGGAPVHETDKTRELDNEGVLMLQKQIMENQDQDAEDLLKIVRRQKEMGLAIHGELVLQNEMLDGLDGDVDRVGRKLGVAKKRIGKIS